MTLQAAISAELPFLRAEAEATHQDTFTPHVPGARTTGADGMEAPAYTTGTPVKGKIQSRARQGDTQARTVRVGEVELPVIEAGLHISLSAAVPTAGKFGVGWEYEMTIAGRNTDASLVGSRWLVVDAPAKSNATARRLDVVQLP